VAVSDLCLWLVFLGRSPKVSVAAVKVAKAAAAAALTWDDDDDGGRGGKAGGLKIVVLAGMFDPSELAADPAAEQVKREGARLASSSTLSLRILRSSRILSHRGAAFISPE